MALVALPSLLFYLSMLSPTITRGGDCGELSTASYLLGIGHPTGYPVWCQIGRLFAYLPVGEIAWRYGAFDALSGALAAGVLAVVIHRLLSPPSASQTDAPLSKELAHERFCAFWGALAGGWMFAGFSFVASQCIISEVYALAGLQGAAILYFLVVWRQSGDWRDAYSLVYLCGSVFVLHLSAIFLLPWVFLAFVWKRPFPRFRVAACVAFFAVALLPWLYFPLRSSLFPAPPSTNINSYFVWPFDWSHPATLDGFQKHVTAAQYRSLLWKTATIDGHDRITGLAQPISQVPHHIVDISTLISLQLLWATPLILVGAVASFRRYRLLALALACSLLFNFAVELNYNVSDQTNFFFPAYLVMAIWMGFGWASVGAFLKRYPLLLPLLILISISTEWGLFGSTSSLAGRTRIGDLSRSQAKTLQAISKPDRPVQFLARQDDTLWPFWYSQYVEGLAPDVVTPWGRALKAQATNDPLPRYVAQLHPRFPVVLAQWNDAVDARFPLEMLDKAGTLCLASNRTVPPPASPIAPPSQPLARFAREPIWANTDDKPAILSGVTAAFEADFQTPRAIGAKDEVVGYLEVLLAPRGHFTAHSPVSDQGEEGTGEGDFHVLSVLFERRRLVAPAHSPANAWLRARVPIWVDPDLPGIDTEVWTRVVPRIGARAQWKQTDIFFITGR